MGKMKGLPVYALLLCSCSFVVALSSSSVLQASREDDEVQGHYLRGSKKIVEGKKLKWCAPPKAYPPPYDNPPYSPSPEYKSPPYSPSPDYTSPYSPSPDYKSPPYSPSPEYKSPPYSPSPEYKSPPYSPSPEYKSPPYSPSLSPPY